MARALEVCETNAFREQLALGLDDWTLSARDEKVNAAVREILSLQSYEEFKAFFSKLPPSQKTKLARQLTLLSRIPSDLLNHFVRSENPDDLVKGLKEHWGWLRTYFETGLTEDERINLVLHFATLRQPYSKEELFHYDFSRDLGYSFGLLEDALIPKVQPNSYWVEPSDSSAGIVDFSPTVWSGIYSASFRDHESYIGYSDNPALIKSYNKMADALGSQSTRLLRPEFGPDWKIPPARLYILSDKMDQAQLDQVLASLQNFSENAIFKIYLKTTEGSAVLQRLRSESWLKEIPLGNDSPAHLHIFQVPNRGDPPKFLSMEPPKPTEEDRNLIAKIQPKLDLAMARIHTLSSSPSQSSSSHLGSASWSSEVHYVPGFATDFLPLAHAVRGAFEYAGIKPGQKLKFQDIGSGWGNLGTFLGLAYPQVDFTGYEINPARVKVSNEIYHELGLTHSRAVEQDLSSPDFQVSDADFYYMYSPVNVETMGKIFRDLQRVAGERAKSRRKIYLIARYAGQFSTLLAHVKWLKPVKQLGPSIVLYESIPQ